MAQTQTQKYREKILSRVRDTDIPGYIYEEVEKMIEHIHYYKLRNIIRNADMLVAYLSFLDGENHKQIKKLLDEESPSTENIANIAYFVSQNTRDEIGEEKILSLLDNNHLQPKLQAMMLGIQGLLLLTANEFCHASPTRISLNKLQRERKLNKQL